MPLFLNEECELLNLRTFTPVRTKITALLMASCLSCTRASRASFASLAASRLDDEAIGQKRAGALFRCKFEICRGGLTATAGSFDSLIHRLLCVSPIYLYSISIYLPIVKVR